MEKALPSAFLPKQINIKNSRLAEIAPRQAEISFTVRNYYTMSYYHCLIIRSGWLCVHL